MSRHAWNPDPPKSAPEAPTTPNPGKAADPAAIAEPILTRRERRERERMAEAASMAQVASAVETTVAPEPVDASRSTPAATIGSRVAAGVAGAAAAVEVPEAAQVPDATDATDATDGIPRTNPIPLPVLVMSHESRPAPPLISLHGRQPEHASRRMRRFGKPLFSLLAMAFAAAMAVATTVPANAMLSQADLATASGFSTTSHGAGQSMLGDDDASASVVMRDNVDVKSQEQVYSLGRIQRANTFTNDPRGTIQWPFPVGVPISDWFGPRSAPTAGASTFHEGIDFTPGNGTPIQSIADGVVREVEPLDNSGYGVHVIIDHMIDGKLVSSLYGHMQVGSIRVAEGQSVKVTDIVGLVGSTGVSTGPHLHFEIHLNGTEPVDPYAWLRAHAN